MFYVTFHNTEGTFPYNFTVEKLTGGTWNTVTGVTWSGQGTYQEVQRRATADLTASGPGRYRFRYKHPNNCSDICSREFDAQLPNTSNPAKALDDWQFAYGIYENTGTIFRQFIGSDKNISYPVTINLTPADGRKAISFATRLPFTETVTKQLFSHLLSQILELSIILVGEIYQQVLTLFLLLIIVVILLPKL